MIVDCRVPELRAKVAALSRHLDALEPGSSPAFVLERAAEGTIRLLRLGACLEEGEREGTLLGRLERELATEGSRLLSARSVFHAGVASTAWGGILVAGRSGSGKSTLVTALVERGLDYVTDDAAVALEDGRVSPYPRPIMLRAGARELLGPLGDRFLRVSYDLEGCAPFEYLVPRREATAADPRPIGTVAFLERRGPARGLEATSISTTEAAARLVAHASNGGERRRDLGRACRIAACARRRLVLTSGTPREIAEALLSAGSA